MFDAANRVHLFFANVDRDVANVIMGKKLARTSTSRTKGDDL